MLRIHVDKTFTLRKRFVLTCTIDLELRVLGGDGVSVDYRCCNKYDPSSGCLCMWVVCEAHGQDINADEMLTLGDG
jgi:hypothetical protein